jgi:hypothetical protein
LSKEANKMLFIDLQIFSHSSKQNDKERYFLQKVEKRDSQLSLCIKNDILGNA